MSNQFAVRGYHTFPVNPYLFRVPVDCHAAIIASDQFLIHGTHMVHRETFLKNQLQYINREHLFMVVCCMEETEAWSPWAECDSSARGRRRD